MGSFVQCVHCLRSPQCFFASPKMQTTMGPLCTSKTTCIPLPVALVFPADHPMKMVGDRLELHEVWVEFILKGLEPPCLVLQHEFCENLYTPDNKVVKKPNNPTLNQYLKVLKPIVLDWHPFMVGCPYDVRPTRDNTMIVDDNASKNVLNLTSIFTICFTSVVGKVQDRFCLNLVKYLQMLMGSRLLMP